MILIFYLFHFINSEFIKNYKYPSCKNCIHFIPHLIDNKICNEKSKCKLFGFKDIINDEIISELAFYCRNSANYCGAEGKYFEKNDNIELDLALLRLNNYIKNFKKKIIKKL